MFGSVTRELGALSGLVVICIALSISAPESFPKASNFINIVTQVSHVAIIAAGMTLVIISGGIDLSVGSLLAFSACVGGYLAHVMHLSPWITILGALVAGAGFGLVNGLLVTRLSLQPFIATLGVMGIARGLAMRITNGGTFYELSPQFLYLGDAKIWHFPVAILAVVVVYVVVHVVLAKMKVGRYTYAIGGNEDASRLSGVPVNQTKIFVYVLTGLLAAVAGLIVAGRDHAVVGTDGDGLELDVIAAVVIGGTSLSGGQGRLIGSLIGALIMGVVRNGLVLLNVDPNWQKAIIGAIIVVAVVIDAYQKKRSARAAARIRVSS